jgi:uncharacterized membrane protein YhaH (DUF805 family)
VTSDEPSIHFLYRTDQGRIGAGGWWKGVVPLGVIFIVLTVGAALSKPFMKHDLATSPFFSWPVLAAYVYIIVYVFALILVTICFYNLSAKRWRDRGKPSALAGLLPFIALLSGAAHWLYPQMNGEVPAWSLVAIDAAFVIVLIWSVVELGLLRSRPGGD